MTISLGRAFPPGSSSLPGTRRRAASRGKDLSILSPTIPAWPCSRWGLPGRPHYCERRWSLTRGQSCPLGNAWRPHHLFTLACNGAGSSLYHPSAVCFCGPIQQVPWQNQVPAPGITRHRALWSADFPRPRMRGRDHPACLRPVYHTTFLTNVKFKSRFALDKTPSFK